MIKNKSIDKWMNRNENILNEYTTEQMNVRPSKERMSVRTSEISNTRPIH